MVYPGNFEAKIEFDSIRSMVRDFCTSVVGKELVDQISFLTNRQHLSNLLDETIEFAGILENTGGFPAQDIYDLRSEMERISIEGSFISLDHLFDLKSSVSTTLDVVKFIKNITEPKIPRLKEIIAEVSIDPFIVKAMDAILDDRGNIRDNASPELKDIRIKLIQKEKSVNHKIAQNLKAAKQKGWVNSDVEVTIRDGRQVIPIPATHKRKIPGLVLDESATGQTVYVEPGDVLEVSNEIRELRSAERREITRILKTFTADIRPFIPDLLNAFLILGRIDFIRAKARLTLQIKGRKPQLKSQPGLEWIGAVHPLLYLSHKKQKKAIVPLSLQLEKANRILVISGPNAGGKSVCLKTVGLLQYMLQCGFPIPVKDGSSAGIFYKLFIDIGDEQSLENDLSTYSSHLLNMKNLVLNGQETTLFLIDEFGTGTEPRLGGAIAETILEKLNEKKCFGVITTHYSNLKLLAKNGNGIINGAMLFDTNKMEPLYELAIGKPGSSFAFEIAQKIGFPKELLQNAELKTGKKQLDFDQQLQQLDIEKRQLDQKREEFNVADSFLSEMIEKYENLKNDLESQKKKIISDAKVEALKLLDSSNKLIEHTIKEIRESEAEKKKTIALRKQLWASKEKMKEQVSNNNQNKKQEKKTVETKIPPIDQKIRVGDVVSIPEQEIKGEVLSIHGDEVVLGFNSISFRTQLSKVEKVNQGSKKDKIKTSRSRQITEQMNDKMANFSFQMDVRGMRGEEAVEKVRQYLDDAIQLSIKEVKILHGKGHGILRNLIHDFLKGIPEVSRYKDEHIERGGHGITVVILK